MFLNSQRCLDLFKKKQMVLHWKQLKTCGLLSSIPVTGVRKILISKLKPTEGTRDRNKTSQLILMFYTMKQSRHPFLNSSEIKVKALL